MSYLSSWLTQHCRTVSVWQPLFDAFVHHLNRLLLLAIVTLICWRLLRPHGHRAALGQNKPSRETIEDDRMTFDVLLKRVTAYLVVLTRNITHRPTLHRVQLYIGLYRPTSTHHARRLTVKDVDRHGTGGHVPNIWTGGHYHECPPIIWGVKSSHSSDYISVPFNHQAVMDKIRSIFNWY